MGGKVSKPARKLTKTISKDVGSSVNRSANVNQLPNQDLKQRYERRILESTQHHADITPDDGIASEAKGFEFKGNDKIDTSLLSRKLKNKNLPQNDPQIKLPEGKDGFDPQVGSYDQSFVRSITHLGKQVKSREATMKDMNSSLAVQQLKSRRQLYERGQKEASMEERARGTEDYKGEIEKNMVHPRILSAILKDLHDSRVSKERLAKDFQLHPDFLNKLSKRFKVADTRIIMEDKLKEDEIGPSVEGSEKSKARNQEDEKEREAEIGEKISQERLRNLSKRISLED